MEPVYDPKVNNVTNAKRMARDMASLKTEICRAFCDLVA